MKATGTRDKTPTENNWNQKQNTNQSNWNQRQSEFHKSVYENMMIHFDIIDHNSSAPIHPFKPVYRLLTDVVVVVNLV